MDRQPIHITKQSSLPTLPHGHLPKPVADWCLEISRSLGTDPTMAINMATSIVASLFQRHFDAEIYPGYRECMACYTAVLAEPGERKTAVWKALMSPVKQHSIKNRRHWNAQMLINQGKAKSAKKTIESMSRGEFCDVDEVAKQVEVMEKAKGEKQFVLEDFTSAALIQTMATNSSILISTDEGEAWKRLGGSYNEDIGLLLRAHTAEPYVCNRKGDEGSMQIDRPIVSMCISMQPSVLSNSTQGEALSGQGLTARMFFAIPESRSGKFDVKYKPYDQDTAKAYENWMTTMCDLINDETESIVHINASEGALALFEEFSMWCMWESRQDDEAKPYEINKDLKIAKLLTKTDGPVGTLTNVRGWSSKLSGAAVRIACIRAAARNMQYAGSVCPQINSDDAAHAINFCIQSIPHTLAANRLLGGENWLATNRAKEIMDDIGWPIKDITIGRLANLLRDASGSRAGVDRCITDLIEKEWFISVDAKTVRSNTNLVKVEQVSTPVQLA
jgi:hypothetical protein